MSERIARACMVVVGRVQGVGYRAFAYAAALRCGVRGGVRNLPDGKVEIEAEGERGAIEAFVECLSAGPPRAKIEGMHVQWQLPTGLPVDFQIWY